MYSRHQGEAVGDQIRSTKTTVLCMPSPPRAGYAGNLSCSTVLRNSTSKSRSFEGRCHCWRCQCGSKQILQKAGVPRCAQFFSCRHVVRDATWGQYGMTIWKQTIMLHYSINNYFSQLRSASDLESLLHGYSLMVKTTWTQSYEKTLEQHSWRRLDTR